MGGGEKPVKSPDNQFSPKVKVDGCVHVGNSRKVVKGRLICE